MKQQETAQSLDYNGMLRVHVFTGHCLLIDEGAVSAYLEFKLDGDTRQSSDTIAKEAQFDSVLLYDMNYTSNPKRQLLCLLCNSNKIGYVHKYTMFTLELNTIGLLSNKPEDIQQQVKIKGKSVTICFSLTFLHNSFIQNYRGDVVATLATMNPSKGILAINLANQKPVCTSISGTSTKTFNDTILCKILILYYENAQISEYLGVNQTKLSKLIPTAKVEYYLCELDWTQQTNQRNIFKSIRDKIKLGGCTIKMQFLLTTQMKQQVEQVIEDIPQAIIIKQERTVLDVFGIKIVGFPYKEIPSPQLIVVLEQNGIKFISNMSHIPVWKTSFILTEQDYTITVYDYSLFYDAATKSKKELIRFNGHIGELTKTYTEFLRKFYATNPAKYTQLMETTKITITVESQPYSSRFTYQPIGFVQVAQNPFQINDFMGLGSFTTQSIFDYISIKEYNGKKISKQTDIPVYKIDFAAEQYTMGNQVIKLYYEEESKANLNNKLQVENYANSNYAKLTIYTVEIDKAAIDVVQVIMTINQKMYRTSKNRGSYFGQEFLIKFPGQLNIQVNHEVDKNELYYIQDTYQSSIDLSKLELIGTQFINFALYTGQKKVLLTIKLELSGQIETFISKVTPQCCLLPTSQGQYIIKYYDQFRSVHHIPQFRTENDKIIFESFELNTSTVHQPLRFQLCYSNSSNYKDATIIQELIIQSIDLNWQLKDSYQFDKLIFNVSRKLNRSLKFVQNVQQVKQIEPCRKFLKFTLLDVKFVQDMSDDHTIGSVIQLRHLTQDSVDRLMDHNNYQLHNQLFEYDRTELNCKYYPISCALNSNTKPFSLVKLHQVGPANNFVYGYKIIQAEMEAENGEFFMELNDEKNRPILLKYKLEIIRHFRFNLTQVLELKVLDVRTINDHQAQFQIVGLEDTPWIYDSAVSVQYKASDCPAIFQLEDIEGALEFVIFNQNRVHRRYIIHLHELQFQYDIEKAKGIFNIDYDGIKCALEVTESKLAIEDQIGKRLKLANLLRIKNLASKYVHLKFSNGLDKYAFNYSLKYTFLTSNPIYITTMLQIQEQSLAQEQEYLVISPQKDVFPVYCSVQSIYLGDIKLTLLSLEEIRGDDGDTIVESRIQVRDTYICCNAEKQLRCITKDGENIPLDKTYLQITTIKSVFQLGRFTLTIARLLRHINPDYVNKSILGQGTLTIKLKYNKQKYLINDINDMGLNKDGIFPKFIFYVSNIEDTLLIQLKIKNFIIAETDLCLPIIKNRFIQQIPPIYYTNNDMVYHYHKKLNAQDIWIMGAVQSQAIDWVKVFIRFDKLVITLPEEQIQLNHYSLTVANVDYSWTSKVYSNDQQSFTIIFDSLNIVQALVLDDLDQHFKISVRMNQETLVDKYISLKPFIKRKGQTMEFPLTFGDTAQLYTTIEISNNFKSVMQKKPKVVKVPFDFRKQGYQQLFIQVLNNKIDMVIGLNELFEFLIYNLPQAYDPMILLMPLMMLFRTFTDKPKVMAIITQCIATIFTSHRDRCIQYVEDNKLLMLSYLEDLVSQTNKQFNRTLNIVYIDAVNDIAIAEITELECDPIVMLTYLDKNKYKVQVDEFADNQDRIKGQVLLNCIKIFDMLIYGHLEKAIQLINHIPLLIEAYLLYDEHVDNLGNNLCLLINSLLDQYNDTDFNNYMTSSQIQNIDIGSFSQLQDVLLLTLNRASQVEFIPMLKTINQLCRITKQKIVDFMTMLLQTIPKSCQDPRSLEVHMGILVEYFTTERQEIIKAILPKYPLEPIANKIIQLEFKNNNQSLVLCNLFDVIIQTIESGIDDKYNDSITFLSKNTPAQQLNQQCIDKFLLYMNKRQERAQKIQMLKEKKEEKQPLSIADRKKNLMQKYLITNLPW